MTEFIDAALSFPGAVFTYPLLVVVLFWLVVIFGAAEPGLLDGDADLDVDADAAPGGFAGVMASLGLGGVPVTVVLSLWILLAWSAATGGHLLLGDAPSVLLVGVLVAAVFAAWLVTRVLVVPLRSLVPSVPPSRKDFIGKVCVIRTGRADHEYGQAEITSEDGSSAIIQVRVPDGEEPITSGSTALIFEYDAGGEFFLVAPYDAELAP